MNLNNVIKASVNLDDAIVKIDMLLRQYPFVTKIDIAKKARIQLELVSKLLNNELESDSQDGEPGDNGERESIVDEGNSVVDEGNNSNDSGGEDSGEPVDSEDISGNDTDSEGDDDE